MTALATSDALAYALSTLGSGVRQALGAEVHETERDELLAALGATFGGPEELKGALEEAFERSLQCLVIGLKQAWLLMETGGEHDYCEAFGERVRAPFVAEHGLEGRLFIDFLDGFFLDHDTAVDAASELLGLSDFDGGAFFAALLGAGEGGEAAELAAHASAALRSGFVEGAGLEDEHPIVRLGCWRELLADGIHYHFTEMCRVHPSWSRYLDPFGPEALDREEGRAIARRDQAAQAQVALVRGLSARRERYAADFGEILPNREWLFDIADRLEETEENVESHLLKGRTIAAHDLPKIVAAGVKKVHAALGTSPVGRLADVLQPPPPALKDVLRRGRKDFLHCHWSGEEYGEAALQLAGAMLPLAGPQAAERYYREAAAFGADRATCEHGLYLTSLLTGELGRALDHLRRAVELAPDRFAPFDFARYRPEAILGAGGSGPTFLVSTEAGERAVVKALWDPVGLVDPRPGLKPLAELHRAETAGLARLLHLGVNLKEFPYVATAFVEGDDLESFRELRGGDAPSPIVATIGAKIAERLVAVHATGGVHRNLKPGNVRVGAGEEGLEVTLLDPCVPNVLLAAPGRVANVRRLLAWSTVGRMIAEDFAAYTAPELIRGGLGAASAASDLYALGGVLYRLSTGAQPRNIEPAALPGPLREVVVRCLSPDPAQRPAGAQEVQALLEAAAELPDEPPQVRAGRGGAAPRAAAAPPPPPPPAAAPPRGAATAPPSAEQDPFALPTAPGGDPFAAPADPFAAPADPFAAPADPFAAPADPFAAPADPFAAPADPFAAPASGDPFAAPADPFAAPASGDPFAAPADPFAAPASGDPFAAPPSGDPFAAPPSGDPFAAPADPFAAPQGADPFAAPADPFAAPADPFAAPRGADPFAAPADPFAAPAAGFDPFAPAPGFADPLAGAVPADPFAAVPVTDPFASTSGIDPFASYGAPAPVAEEEEELEALDPNEALAMLESMLGPSTKKPAPAAPQARGPAPPAQDPFAQAAPDPFAQAAAGFDPFAPAAPAGAGFDPFAQAAGAAGGDPFAQAAGPAGGDPFAQPPASAGFDPFAAAAQQGAAPDPFAQAAANDPFAAAAQGQPGALDPFAAAAQAPPGAVASSGGLWLSAEEEISPFHAAAQAGPPQAPPPTRPQQPAVKPAAAGARPAKKRAAGGDGGGERSYGLVISGLSLKSKKDAAVEVLMEIKGISEAEARDMCRSPVVPVLKNVSKEECEAAEAKFKAAKINCRVSTKKKRK